MTKKDKWLLWVVLILVVLPALRGVIKHDKKPIQRSVVWIEYKIDSAVAWVDNKIDTGIIYVFVETGEDILTREFGDRFTYDFIFSSLLDSFIDFSNFLIHTVHLLGHF